MCGRGRSRQRKTRSKSKGPRKGAFVRALEKRLASALCDASSAAEGGKAAPPPIVDAAGLLRPKARGLLLRDAGSPTNALRALPARAIRPCFSPQRSQNTASSARPEKPGFFARSRFFSWRGLMRAGRVALAVIAIAALTSGPSEARAYAHRHGHYGCHLYDDYTHSNALSADSYIYPAANWGPFFHCRMYYSPVLVVPASPY